MKLGELKADRATIVVGTSMGLVLLALLWALFYFWSLRQDFAQQIDAIEPRTSRLLGIMQSAEQLSNASSEARGALRDLVLPAGRDSANVAASLQQDVREVMTDAGLSISGSQILPTRRAEGYDRLILDIRAEGNVDALNEALAELELLRPMVFIESVKIKPTRTRASRRRQQQQQQVVGDPRKLSAQFKLFALRLHR